MYAQHCSSSEILLHIEYICDQGYSAKTIEYSKNRKYSPKWKNKTVSTEKYLRLTSRFSTQN